MRETASDARRKLLRGLQRATRPFQRYALTTTDQPDSAKTSRSLSRSFLNWFPFTA